MNEFESHAPQAAKGRKLTVVYKGTEPPPDTFKDDAQALAMGTIGRDGVFHATALQAKCASKYAPAQPGAKPGQTPAQPSTASPRASTAAASQPGSAAAGIATN
jgi:cytochrome c-type biogenesis protein CcmE